METRDEHLSWCKKRALEYVAAGDVQGAFNSMASDLRKHPETLHHESTSALGLQMMMMGDLSTPAQMREWITGYN